MTSEQDQEQQLRDALDAYRPGAVPTAERGRAAKRLAESDLDLDDFQGEVFFNRHEILIVVQELATMFECRCRNDAVVALADSGALSSQPAINVSRTDEYSLRHRQHDQGAKIGLNAPICGVIGNALEDLCQYDATQGKVLISEDELLQRDHMWQLTPREEVNPDAGIDQNH